MTAVTLFGQPSNPATLVSDPTGYTMAVQFTISTPLPLDGIWFWSAPGAGSLPGTIALFAVGTQTLVHSESATWSGAAASGWVFAAFSSKPSLSAATNYKAAVFNSGGSNWYSATSAYYSSGPGSGGISNPPLSAPNDAGTTSGQDSFNQDTLGYPQNSFNAANYWVDPQVTVAGAAPSGLLIASYI